MKKMFVLLVSCTAMIAFSCTRTVNPLAENSALRVFEQEGIEATFMVTDSQGNQKSSFDFAEDIHFAFTIENRSDLAKSYGIDGGPFVTFEVYAGEKLVGTSDDGFAWILQHFFQSIEANDKIERKSSWLSSYVHPNLEPGRYTVKARPRLLFTDKDSLQVTTIEIDVVCPSQSDCDSLQPVVISDLSHTDVHQDAFALNDASVKDNTLTMNISYGGGCAEHDFVLFASSFMESNPVQVNLLLRHLGNDDNCEAYLTRNVSFDLSRIAEAYVEQYGGPDPVILNVFEFYREKPGKVIKVDYRF